MKKEGIKNFHEIGDERILYKGKRFFIIEDGFPVSPGHLLIVSQKLRKDYFELSGKERRDLVRMIGKARRIIERRLGYKPDGWNIGMNCGEFAGQTVFHFHCHVIPRYRGDMLNPRGGVRHCLHEKGYYNEFLSKVDREVYNFSSCSSVDDGY